MTATYLILADDGNQYGPIAEAELRGWIREGRVQAHNQAYLEGASEWKPLNQHPALRDCFSAPPVAKPPLPPRPAVAVAATPAEGVPTRTVVCSYILAVLMPFIGFFLGVYLMAKKQIGHGVACMALSVFFFFVFLQMQM